MRSQPHLLAIQTHPIQYYAPIYRALQQTFDVKVTAIYGSDFSVVGYLDKGFNTTFKWDVDLLEGYHSVFLERVAHGGAQTMEEVTGRHIFKAIGKIEPSAIMLTGYNTSFHRRAFLAARRLPYPLLFRAETTDHGQPRHPIKSMVRDVALRLFYHHFAALLPVGVYARRHYQRLAPDKPLFFSPACVDTAPFQTDALSHTTLRALTRQSLQILPNQPVILFSGKLAPYKDPLLIIRAVKQLPDELRQQIIVLFMGDGELRQAIEQSADTEPYVQIHILGFQNQSQLSQYYQCADLLVLPSIHEPWGLVVNDALHHGLPAVVSDRVICGPDLIKAGETGFIFPAQSSDALMVALQKGLTLASLPATRVACQTHVQNYSVLKAAEGVAQAVYAIAPSQ